MAIKDINTVITGLAGVNPRWVYIDTNDSTTTVLTTGYLTKSATDLGFSFTNKDMALVSVIDSAVTSVIICEVSISNGIVSLLAPINPGNVTLPVVSGDFSVFDGTTGRIKDAGYSASDATKTKVVMANAAVIANHIAVYTDTAGTISDDAATAINGGNIQAGLSGTAGYFASFPSAASKGSLRVTAVANTGDTLVTVSNAAHGQATVVSIPDGGQATTEFIIADSAGTQHITSGGLQVDAGAITSGLAAGGFVGQVTALPTTAASGAIELLAAINASGDFGTSISNATTQAQDQVVTVPDSGAATANFLLDTGAANIIAMQEFVGLNGILMFSTGTWTTTRNAQGNYSSNKTQADETSIVGFDITPQIRVAASKGFRLDSFDVIYQITTLALDAHSVTLDRIVYANEVAVSVNAVAITGTLATATNANPRVTNVAVDVPAFDVTANSKYVIELTVDSGATSDYAFYGLTLHFSQTIA